MRRSLRSKYDERVTRRNFRVVRSQVEQNRWAIGNLINRGAGFNASAIVANGGAGGSSGYYADAEHTHSGQPYITDTSLPSYHATNYPNGIFGYRTDEHKMYQMVNGSWVALSPFDEVSILPAIPTSGYKIVFGTTNGHLWYAASGYSRWYAMSGKWTNDSGAVGATV